MLAVRVAPVHWLAPAVRGDDFVEERARSARGAAAIFRPVTWVRALTAGLRVAPHDHLAVYLEHRHDRASGPAYYWGAVARDGASTPYLANTKRQDTVTAGAPAWF